MQAAIDVGDIHAAVGADQAVVRLGDQNAILAAHDPLALRESDFSDASIQMVFASPFVGTRRRLDGGEFHESSFRLGNDLVLDDQNVTLLGS